jgi:hypothetical protein
VGSIPTLGTNRINNLDRINPHGKNSKKGPVVLKLSLLQKNRSRFSSENLTENADLEIGADRPETR